MQITTDIDDKGQEYLEFHAEQTNKRGRTRRYLLRAASEIGVATQDPKLEMLQWREVSVG